LLGSFFLVSFIRSPRITQYQSLTSFVLDQTCIHAVAHLVEALWYKPEGRGFDS
jgi:hypothetical protein